MRFFAGLNPPPTARLLLSLFTLACASFGSTHQLHAQRTALQSLSCSKASLAGPGTDTCTIALRSPAQRSNLRLSLRSSSSAVAVPPSAFIPVGSSTATFTATVAAVPANQTVTLTARNWHSTARYSITLTPAQAQTSSTLSVNATSISFGNVAINQAATQTVVLTAQGGPVTVNSLAASGAGFSFSGSSLPVTINAGQSLSLNVKFAPTSAGNATGGLAIGSSAGSRTVALSGASSATTQKVNLTWAAPTSQSSPLAGYNVYRATGGTSSYQELNSSVTTTTSFTDSSVQSGETYQYYVESVDSSGQASTPSNTATIIVP